MPVQLPIGAENYFDGIVDLVLNKAFYFTDDLGSVEEREIPADMADDVASWREHLLEAVAETDEDIMMKYLDGEELTVDEIKTGLRKATIAVKAIPVFCGSSFKTKMFRCCWTVSLITARLRLISLLSKVSWLIPVKRLKDIRPTARTLAHWPLRL